jgi:hypothetical protein
MFHWRLGRRLPRDIELEVETLLSDLRGVPLRPGAEMVRAASSGHRPGLGSLSRLLSHARSNGLRRRSAGGPGVEDRR